MPEIGHLMIELVPCGDQWQYRTLNFISIDGTDQYPGEPLFDQRAYSDCDRRYTTYWSPSADSWALGDRKVTCLQESFGLSGADPSKLDRLIDSNRLNAEECFNEAPETGYLMVELVNCSAGWQYRTLNSFSVDGGPRYPGESAFRQNAYVACDRRYTSTHFPSTETWAVGDRKVTCLQKNYGLSEFDPSRLDRLVDSSRLNVEECFNEVPESEYGLMEIVRCSGEWEFQATGKFSVPLDDAYPGDRYFEDVAGHECDPSTDFYFFPFPETWSMGDRSIICVKSSE